MLPFLAEVQVINVAGSANGYINVAVRPDPHAQVDEAINTARLITNAALDAAHTAADGVVDHFHMSVETDAAKDRADAAKDRAEAAKDRAEASDDSKDGDSSDVTIKTGTHGVVIHKHKSDDGDVVFAFIPIVAITFTFLYLIIRALMAPFTNRARRGPQVTAAAAGLTEEEVALLAKLQRTLAQMENRVDSLETILIDQARTKENYGTKL